MSSAWEGLKGSVLGHRAAVEALTLAKASVVKAEKEVNRTLEEMHKHGARSESADVILSLIKDVEKKDAASKPAEKKPA